MELPARIEQKIEYEPSSGCWVWIGARSGVGYGMTSTGGHATLAHRLIYQAFRGSIPNGTELDHLCRLRCCVNPAHLEPVTRAENLRRGENPRGPQANKTSCPRGHPYDWIYQGGRRCRQCSREQARLAARRYRARHRL